MLTRETRAEATTQGQRRALRALSTQALKEAYGQLLEGHNEQFVCACLGVRQDIMEGSLRRALEEALWERGQLPRSVFPSDRNDTGRGCLAI